MTTNRMGLEQTLSDERLEDLAKGQYFFARGAYEEAQAMARELLAYRKASKEAGKVRRFDLDMSDCDSCGQDCGADMIEDLDGEYVLWEEVIPYLYQHAEYAAPPLQAVTVPDDKQLRAMFDAWFASDCSFDRSPDATEEDNIAWRESYWYVWKRCCAAMLKSATNEP